ncbi:MAG: hypothetical protein RLZ05_766 [Bacteroidota bacterium]|jgi:uncharacterized protein YqfB (UPF0267 family)
MNPMKKVWSLLLILISLSTVTLAQVYEGTAEFDKKKYTAFLAEYDYQVPAVENALLKRFAKLGYRPREEKGIFNKDKGFRVFAGSIMSDITEGAADYYVKVEDRSKKGKEAALLTVIILQNGEALSRGVSEARANAVKSYLKSLLPDIIAENLELDIKAQEEAISKAEKKLESLKREKAELERKIEVNERTQLDTENEIKAKQEGLEILKSKRTTTPVSPSSGSAQKTNP